jgi:hypothetical protein
MAYEYADYSPKSERLIEAGRQLIRSLEDEGIDRSIAIQEIESAAQGSTASELVVGFTPSSAEAAGPAERISAEDALSSVLLDIQAANVLLSAGLALNEHGRGSEVSSLEESLSNLQGSRSEVTQDLEKRAKQEFAPGTGVKSVSLDAAKETFRKNADDLLTAIVDDANTVVNDVLEKLKKFDSTKILEAINKLGESFQGISAAGNLIRRGLDMLKNAIDALSKLLGKEGFASAKKKFEEILKNFQSGKYTRKLLEGAFAVDVTKKHIEELLNQAKLDIAVIDSATNDLPGLSDKYKSTMKLFRSLMSAVALAGTILALLHFVAPWIPLALAGVYAALIGATVLVGMDYADSGRVLRWVRGVGEIASGIKPPSKP